MDYEKIGLKAGLEIHQQLNTNKLFCNCPTILRNDEPIFKVKRKLNPVVGETGKIDSAALYENEKKQIFEYLVYDTNCLVELDEEPPHEINQDSLKIAIQIALLFNCKIFPVTQVMRKTVIDGSNTSGFQRTVLIGYDGYVNTTQGIVRIETIALEEDSARKLDSEKISAITQYKLDRLGFPLVEITTYPDLKSPEQIKEAALKIGEVLRSCEIKRGIGTIRQDLNISIKGGNRVEIKGFQDPRIMIQTIENEIQRQTNLIKLRPLIKKIKLNELKDLSKYFQNTKCNLIKNGFGQKKQVYGLKLTNASGLLKQELQPNKRIGTDLSDSAKPTSKIGGIIHSDENLGKYNFSNEEILNINKELQITNKDAFILFIAEALQAKEAYSCISKRITLLSNEVPKEVRQVNTDSTTKFLRPMPGSSRMYPETDLKLLRIKKDLIDNLKKNLPKLAKENKKYLQEFGLNLELIQLLLKQNKIEDFKTLTSICDHYNLIAKSLTIFPKEFSKRLNLPLKNIEEKINLNVLTQIFQKVPEEISPNDVKNILYSLLNNQNLEEIISKKNNDLNLEEDILKLIEEKPNLSKSAYMGLLMNQYKGIVNGKILSDTLSKLLK